MTTKLAAFALGVERWLSLLSLALACELREYRQGLNVLARLSMSDSFRQALASDQLALD
jgi:hypothetical protein